MDIFHVMHVTRRRRLVLSVTTAMLVVAFTATPSSAAHNQATLFNDEVLVAGQRLRALGPYNTAFKLELQGDGNMVLYRENNKALYASWTQGQAIGWLGMQPDGNAVLYNQAGNWMWQTNTFGSGHRLHIRSNGDLVVLNSAGGQVKSMGTTENLLGGQLQLMCGFDANRTAQITVRRPINNGTVPNTRAREVVNAGVWWWNFNTPTVAPPFGTVDEVATGPQIPAEIVASVDFGLPAGVAADATGADAGDCPSVGGESLRMNTHLLAIPEWRSHTGPHELGHFLGLTHWPGNHPLSAPHNTWDPSANPAMCQYTPLMWPYTDDGGACARYAPVGVDVARIGQIYN